MPNTINGARRSRRKEAGRQEAGRQEAGRQEAGRQEPAAARGVQLVGNGDWLMEPVILKLMHLLITC